MLLWLVMFILHILSIHRNMQINYIKCIVRISNIAQNINIYISTKAGIAILHANDGTFTKNIKSDSM